jgi:hypothetical protein
MSQLFERVTKAEVNKAVEDVLFNQLRDLLQNREPGHCMRVSDLDPAVMRSLCERLHQAIMSPHVFLLSADGSKSEPILITGSKLVELRNPLPDGTLRPPLLVFVPNELTFRIVMSNGYRPKSMLVSRTAMGVRMSQPRQLLKERLATLARLSKTERVWRIRSWRRRIDIPVDDLRHDVMERITLGQIPDGHGDHPAWLEYSRTDHDHRKSWCP